MCLIFENNRIEKWVKHEHILQESWFYHSLIMFLGADEWTDYYDDHMMEYTHQTHYTKLHS